MFHERFLEVNLRRNIQVKAQTMDSNNNSGTKVPAAALKQLEIFAGKWKIEGKNFPDAPTSGATPVQGEDSYEWLEGNFYLIEKWKHQFEMGEHQGISVLGFDEVEHKLFTRNFDNIGYERKYIMEQENNKWNFIGDNERATRIFSSDGNSFTEHWEIKTAGEQWAPLCVMHGTKL